jgi:hypothetical protein
MEKTALYLHSLQNIISVFIPRRIGWGSHVARMIEMRAVYKILVGKLERKETMKHPGIDNRILSQTT